MANSKDYLVFLEDQFSEFGEIEIKSMFGGNGIFHQGLMIAMIGGDTLRLKVDDHNQADFEGRGMKPYYSGKKKKGMPYWEVPADVIENREELAKWAKKSYEAAVRAKK